MSDSWYYVQNGQRQGPVPAVELARVIQSRAAGADPLVWRAGMPQWVQFSQLVQASLPPELRTIQSPEPIQVGIPVGSGRTPIEPGGMLAYFTPQGDVANVSAKDAKTSMVLGIISVSLLPFYCCSIFGFFAMIASLVCGILALRFARSGGEQIRMGSAVAGRVCGIIGVVGAVIYVFIVIFFIVAIVIDARRTFPTPPAIPSTQPVFVPTPAKSTTTPAD